MRQAAEVENNMNTVERVVYYANEIEQEAPHEIKVDQPPSEWPSEGRVELRDVVFKYRPELPAVLKGTSDKCLFMFISYYGDMICSTLVIQEFL